MHFSLQVRLLGCQGGGRVGRSRRASVFVVTPVFLSMRCPTRLQTSMRRSASASASAMLYLNSCNAVHTCRAVGLACNKAII
jgi:hypothetical protein